jgi:pseudomonalisin/xanthomonalisin
MTTDPKFAAPLVLFVAAAVALLSASSAFALAGATPLLVSGSTSLGAAGGSTSLVLTLTPSNPAGLQELASEQGRARLAAGQFEQSFAPSQASVSAVESWASASGLRVTSVSADRLLVTLSASRSALGAALGVSFERFQASDGASYVSSTGTATLPASIARDVTSITGLSSLERVQVEAPHPAATEAPSIDYPASYDPQQLWSLYHAPSGETGSGEQVSVIAAGDVSQPKADLVTFEHKFGLPSVTWNQIDVGTPSSETEGDDEWDLDTQYSTGFAPGVEQVNVYDGSSLEDSAIIETIDRWVTEDRTTQASFSAGECELLADLAGFSASLDTVLAEAAAQGQTLFTSSGDTGSQCPALVGENGVPAGLPGVNYPASSPYAIDVGGTSVLGPGDEIGWYSGGGGQSLIESTPAWQKDAGGSFIGATRGVPDVAMDADPESGFDVIVDGEEEVIGGTSAGAPSWQGIWTRAQAAHGGALGFAGPVVYETEPEAAFSDIIIGDNGLYPCTPGWDYVTGRGTPNIEAFVADA